MKDDIEEIRNRKMSDVFKLTEEKYGTSSSPVIKKQMSGKKIDGTTVLLLYILSFFIPLAGFIVGAIYASKEEEHYKYVGKNCLNYSLLNIVFGFIMLAIILDVQL